MNCKKDHIFLLVFISLVLLIFNKSGNNQQWKKDNHDIVRCTVSKEMTAGVQGAHFFLSEKAVAAQSVFKILYTTETREFLNSISTDLKIDRQMEVRQSCDISPPHVFRHQRSTPSKDEIPLLG